MNISIIGALSSRLLITEQLIKSLFELPALNMSHGGEFTVKHSPEGHADQGCLPQLDVVRAFFGKSVG